MKKSRWSIWWNFSDKLQVFIRKFHFHCRHYLGISFKTFFLCCSIVSISFSILMKYSKGNYGLFCINFKITVDLHQIFSHKLVLLSLSVFDQSVLPLYFRNSQNDGDVLFSCLFYSAFDFFAFHNVVHC